MRYLIKFQVGMNFSFYRKMNHVPIEGTEEYDKFCRREFPDCCTKENNYVEISEVIDLEKVKEISI